MVGDVLKIIKLKKMLHNESSLSVGHFSCSVL